MAAPHALACLFLFPPTPAELLNETRPTTKHTSAFIQSAQSGTASLLPALNIPPPSTSQTCCTSNNDSSQFGVRMAFPQPVMGKCALSGWVMGLGWTRAPVGTAEHCRIPLQIWHLAIAAHLLRITEFLSIFTATARPSKTDT